MTPYQTVYDAFLSKVNADDWADGFSEVDGELTPLPSTLEDLHQILMNALPNFRFPRMSLATNEDGFVSDLGIDEINIISEYMKIEWLDRTIHTWENVKVMYDERDFSPANLLKQFISLLQQSTKKADNLQKLYSRSITQEDGTKTPFKFSDLAGKN